MYKYIRREINQDLKRAVEKHANLKDENWNSFLKEIYLIRQDLLAQKEDRKEWQKEILLGKDVGSPDGDCKIYGYWDNKTMVITRIEHTNPTPSPLEIEEIPEIKRMIVYPDICEDLAKVVKEIVENQNTLISNQKKLYQYIKSLNQIK